MPIRIRLTLLYSILLGVIFAVFSTLLYMALSFFLYSQVDTFLQDRSRYIGDSIGANVVVSEKKNILFPSLNIFSYPGIVIQASDIDGRVVDSTKNLGSYRIPLSDELLAANKNREQYYQTVTINDTSLRVYSFPIVFQSSKVIGSIQVGKSLEDVEYTLSQVFIFLIIGTVVALFLAVMTGSFMAWAALQPIEQTTQAAAQIVSAQDLEQRLPVAGTYDEIDRLTITINDMLERLHNFFQAQIRLSADVSHELRTPLTTIRGNVDLLRRGAADDPAELDETLSVMEGELDRMSRIVADLLLLSQADAGLSLRMQEVELDTIILDVYRQVRVISNGVNIQLGSEDQAVIRGDSDRLKQLLINLITNGIKHTPPGGTITISLYREPDWVRVVVADTGRGIAPTDLTHVFERFYKAKNNRQKGTGLGLSIAQWIAEAHNGQITVESELGTGSTFTLWLPNIKFEPVDSHPLTTT